MPFFKRRAAVRNGVHAIRISLREARCLRGVFVYALADDEGIFYVGQTRNPDRRFLLYLSKGGSNAAVRGRLKYPFGTVGVVLLAVNPCEPEKTEREEIVFWKRSLLNHVKFKRPWVKKKPPPPWYAGPGIKSPSTFAVQKIKDPEVKWWYKEYYRLLGEMDPSLRCAAEIELFRELLEAHQRRLEKWLDIVTPKMLVCMANE